MKYFFFIITFAILFNVEKCPAQDVVKDNKSLESLDSIQQFSLFWKEFRECLLHFDTITLADIITDTLEVVGHDDSFPILYFTEKFEKIFAIHFFLHNRDNYQLKKIEKLKDISNYFITFQENIIWFGEVDLVFVNTKNGYKLYSMYAYTNELVELLNN